jgi:NitT/TauT family transport system permease protein
MNIANRKSIGVVGPTDRPFTPGDALILMGLAGILYAGIRLASPVPVVGPEIDLSASALPWYALLSVGRMTAAYFLSLTFSLVYGYAMAHSKTAERILMPVLDVLQSVPILSFLPVVLLTLTAILPLGIGVELSAIVLIFTSQAWNLTYSFYQSLRTVPGDLIEASSVFRLNWWYRFRTLELPFGAIGLLWNSVMSWAGGWFFLMAAETFQVGNQDYRLPGLGSYLQAAANAADVSAIAMGVLTLVLVIVLLDQLIWRPLLAWTEKFKVEMIENDNPPTSWFFEMAGRSRLATGFVKLAVTPLIAWLDRRLGGEHNTTPEHPSQPGLPFRVLRIGITLAAGGTLAYFGLEAARMLASVPGEVWAEIGASAVSTGLRVSGALIIAVLWTVPVGVLIGTNPRMASLLQPVVQVLASIPATALFPVMVLALINLPFGLNGAAVLLMLLGTQWYILFNVIAGASALPQDLKDIAQMFKINGWARWRTLILPALFPYIVTGLITAGGGAWNASIVAEYTQFSGQTYAVTGLGAMITGATERADYPVLLAATLTMVVIVVTINRLVWRRLYRLAEEKYRLDA